MHIFFEGVLLLYNYCKSSPHQILLFSAIEEVLTNLKPVCMYLLFQNSVLNDDSTHSPIYNIFWSTKWGYSIISGYVNNGREEHYMFMYIYKMDLT